MKSDVEKSKDDLVLFGKVAWMTSYYLFQVICFVMVLYELVGGIHEKGMMAEDILDPQC